jgi:hypothetical protein
MDSPGSRDRYDRLQFRIADSLQFKLQREITVRDDEIARLNAELATLLAQVGALSVAHLSQNALSSKVAALREKLLNARTSLDIKRAHLETEHVKVMQELRDKHEREIEKLQTVAVDRSPLRDSVDTFLESVRGRRVRTRREPDESVEEREGRRLEQKVAELRGRISNEKKRLRSEAARDEMESTGGRREADDSQDTGGLDADISLEIEKEREVKQEIVRAEQEGQAMDVELQSLVKADQEPDKKARVKELRAEANRLKSEIARLDFMIYGKAGQYQKWRNIKC